MRAADMGTWSRPKTNMPHPAAVTSSPSIQPPEPRSARTGSRPEGIRPRPSFAIPPPRPTAPSRGQWRGIGQRLIAARLDILTGFRVTRKRHGLGRARELQSLWRKATLQRPLGPIRGRIRLPPDKICPECGFDLAPWQVCGACGYDPRETSHAPAGTPRSRGFRSCIQ